VKATLLSNRLTFLKRAFLVCPHSILDVHDFAPGTGTPVCGDLSTVQALEILGGLRGINLVGMDVVEVAPVYDSAEITSLAAATLAMEMLCLYAARHKVDR
jgi:agmatinase